MKKIIITLGIVVVAMLCAFAQKPDDTLMAAPYKNGEMFVYDLKYGFITGGQAILETRETSFEEKNVFHLKGTFVTTGLADKIYSVKDIFESYMDKNTSLPYFAIRNVKEGSYKYYNEVKYNQDSNSVVSLKKGWSKVPPKTLDILSAFWYIRRVDFSKVKQNDRMKILTYFDDRLFPMELIYLGKEKVDTKWGEIRCLKFAPIVEPGRVFKSKNALYVWFSDDENRVPVLISMGMMVGHVYIELQKYNNIKTPMVFQD